MSRDTFVALVGALVIVLAAVGLFVVEGRSGPIEATFVASEVPIVVSGSYQTTSGSGTRGPGDVCVPEPPAISCPSPGTELELRITGLPVVERGHYVLFLSGGGVEPERIGTLARTGAVHTIDLDDDEDRSDRITLLVSLERDPAPAAPARLVVHQQQVGPRSSVAPVDLAVRTTTILEPVGGEVVVDQIGMVSVSATAKGTLTGVTPDEDWVYHAWFRDDSGATATYAYLDTLTVDRTTSGEAVLDARIERVVVAEQDRVVVMLAAADVPPGGQPVGWPVAEAVL